MRARNLKLTVQYDGTDFAGFQRQSDRRTIQGELEANLARIAGHPVRVIGAGRTDAGVHALGQVCNARLTGTIPTARVAVALNSLLPGGIAVVSAEEVGDDFHALRDAAGKVYRYAILNRPIPAPLLRRYCWHVPEALDLERMREAAVALVGEHDFASFCAAGGSAQTTVRELERLECDRSGDLVTITAAARGFLYRMVRIICGTLVRVGRGKTPPERIRAILEARDRAEAGPTAPARGLCLMRVLYED